MRSEMFDFNGTLFQNSEKSICWRQGGAAADLIGKKAPERGEKSRAPALSVTNDFTEMIRYGKRGCRNEQKLYRFPANRRGA